MMLSNHFILCCPLLLLTSLFPSIMVFSNEIKELCAQLLICAQLFDPMDCSPPCSSVHGISQARILERVAISSSKGSSRPKDWTYIFCIVGWFFTTEPSGKPYRRVAAAAAKSFQSCPTLCNPIDSSLPGSPVPGILQTRTLEWVAISFSNEWKWNCSVCPTLSNPMDWSLPGSPVHGIFQAKAASLQMLRIFLQSLVTRWQKCSC